MNFKKFFGIIFAAFVFVFTLTACIFTATGYEPERTPDEPHRLDQDGIRVFSHISIPFNSDINRTMTLQPTNRFTLNHSLQTPASSGFTAVAPVLVPIGFNNSADNLLNNLSIVGNNVSSRTDVLRNHLFVGRYNGLNNTILRNYFGYQAIIQTPQNPVYRDGPYAIHDNNQFSYSLMYMLNDIIDNDIIMGFYNLYFVVFARTIEDSMVRPIIQPNQIISLMNASWIAHSETRDYRHLDVFGGSSNNTSGTAQSVNQNVFPQLENILEIPTDPEIPGTDEDQDNGDIPGEPNEPEEPGTDEDQDNGDNGYEPTPEIAHLSWWEQFFAWLRRQLFVQN